jgi:pyruvate kinase
MERRAKIIATIGPASQDEAMLTELIQAGMNVARINFSHGSQAEHAEVIQRIRQLSAHLDQPVTILQDLQGPKIRTGELSGGSIQLQAGQTLTLTTHPVIGNENQVSVDYPDLPHSVKEGSRILLDDGNLELIALSVDADQVETRVVVGGILKPHKGVNLPGSWIYLPSMTQKDEADLAFGLEQGVDVIALSFVRTADDILQIRKKIGELADLHAKVPVIAKLERPEALDNLDEIVQIADGVMVARGDLGVEMSPQAVPIAQKRIITCANNHAKFVITATQMLDSMIHNPRPTRAEASDVANAIFDGTDAVMLSGETAMGSYPVESVKMMHAIVCQAEEHIGEWGHFHDLSAIEASNDDAFYVTRAAKELAHDRNVSAIAVFTQSGRTALHMSKARPGVPILAFTPEVSSYYRLGMYWGVEPYLVPHNDTIEDMLRVVEAVMVASKSVQPGEQVVLVCGFPVHQDCPANLALLHTVSGHCD